MKKQLKTNQLVHSPCPVCGPRIPGAKPESVLVCDHCLNPDTINAYCPHCQRRWEFSFQEGLYLMHHFLFMEKLPERPGVIIRFTFCPECVLKLNPDYDTFENSFEVFYLDHEGEARRQKYLLNNVPQIN